MPRREAFQRIHNGEIGDVTGMYATYYTGPVKPMPKADKRPEGMGDVAWQVSNWYNFSWLSGDSLVEQAIHSVDKVCWAMKDADPIAAVANGGRQIPAHGGNIYDHFSIVYEFANNVKCHLASRQIPGCFGENADYIQGTKGTCIIGKGPKPFFVGENRWRYNGPNNDMYQEEHNTLFKSIRDDQPVNDGEWMAHSTMVGILGRMAAYTGQRIEWEDALSSKQDLAPDGLKWEDDFKPDPMPMPGKTKFA